MKTSRSLAPEGRLSGPLRRMRKHGVARLRTLGNPTESGAGYGIGFWILTALVVLSLAWLKVLTVAPDRIRQLRHHARAEYRLGDAVGDALVQRKVKDPAVQ